MSKDEIWSDFSSVEIKVGLGLDFALSTKKETNIFLLWETEEMSWSWMSL